MSTPSTSHPISAPQPSISTYHDKTLPPDLEEQATLLSSPQSPKSPWHNPHTCLPHISPLSLLLFLATLLIALITYLSLPIPPPTSASPTHPKTCGPNATTALAAGCTYDILAPQWQLPACYNASLSTSHRAQLTPPLFYKDENLTQPLGEDPEELSGYETIWTTDAYHTQHCAYILELGALAAGHVFRQADGEVWLNSLARNEKHTKHCTDWLTTAVHTPGPVEIHRPGAGLGCYSLEER